MIWQSRRELPEDIAKEESSKKPLTPRRYRRSVPDATVVEQAFEMIQSAKQPIVIAGNGYLSDISDQVATRVMPINSFIAATEPLGPGQQVLGEDIAVADSKFVVNYYRMGHDGSFLFGGRESYTLGFPTDITFSEGSGFLARSDPRARRPDQDGIGCTLRTLGLSLAAAAPLRRDREASRRTSSFSSSASAPRASAAAAAVKWRSAAAARRRTSAHGLPASST